MDFMTSDQYTELIGFLGRRFDGMDRRFDRIEQRLDDHDRRFDDHDRRLDDHDRRFESIDRQFEETRRHAVVLFEQSQANLAAVAEGIGYRIDKLDETVRDLSATVREGFADHERRIRVLEAARAEEGEGS